MSRRRAKAVARPAPPEARPAPRRLERWLAPAIVAAGLAAYANSLDGAFVFDDLLHIRDNPHIRYLWPPSSWLAGTSRPLLQLSLAINYALGGLDPRGYHFVNLAVHLLAGLGLFAVARRAFAAAPVRETVGSAGPLLSAALALLWVVHPLQTQAVTYVIQRSESLMSLFYLLVLLALARSADARRPGPWWAAAVACGALGVATKPVMVTVPLAALLYDRTFLAGSFAGALRRRWPLYAGLVAAVALMPLLLANAPEQWAESAGFRLPGLSPATYALTEAGVLLHYLRLTAWPHPLVLDYAWPPAPGLLAVLPAVLAVVALLGLTLFALRSRPALGFAGAWFFLVLLPTSSVIPIVDPAFEHRMYLPLAAPLALAVVGGFGLWRSLLRRRSGSGRAAWALPLATLVLVALTLALATARRNDDYRSEVAIWSDTVARRPGNARAHDNLGAALKRAGRLDEAIGQFSEALRIAPHNASAHNNLGNALDARGQTGAAAAEYLACLEIEPGHAWANCNLGALLAGQGRLDEAMVRFRRALASHPDFAEAHYDLGLAFARKGELEPAVASYRRALGLRPDLPLAHNNLAVALARLGRGEEAVAEFRASIAIAPGDPATHYNLGLLLARLGRSAEAAAELEATLRLRPDHAPARRMLDSLRSR